ncbi:patatin-like phospholipase family protein [Pelomonas sp. P7]|uniref:Patatin-like phospholipase family protein n=1 Tax=Pelomonas caseinilytica TaxID=2906763 RepID=A0ABS8X653_9BURK|nr:patatin-like phospholipase family protein [Pelomonas sp. P7]MCE4535862.1 patatin-like phospholipase family protein [Pelomonas sp. P7]
MSSGALQILAGPAARARLAERGLRAEDVGLVPAAAGGPKGLILNGLDRFVFGDWLPRGQQTVHLVGASIGAWRMATAALAHRDVAEAFDAMAEAYVTQEYDVLPGEKRPRPEGVSRRFGEILAAIFEGREADVLSHPRLRLHVVTSRGRAGLLAREGRLRTPLGYLGAFAANAVSRPLLGRFLERVVFSDPRDRLPLRLNDFTSREVHLSRANLRAALLASCSIPFWLQAQHDLPGAPRGAYWDGGITDYHLHLDYRALQASGHPLVLYPHFQRQVVPGWLDKALKHRHRSTAFLDNVVLLCPSPQWIASLPGAKLPDRNDFMALEPQERRRRWRVAVAESQRLADEFAALTARDTLHALPL